MDGQRPARVVVGAVGSDHDARLLARALLMSGREVVFVGGGQDAEQMAATARAEDADEVVLDGTEQDREALRWRLESLGLRHVAVTGCDIPDAPHTSRSG